MKKHPGLFILTALLLIIIGGKVTRAAISEPKTFRILYGTEAGTELESVEYSVYAVQQIFLDKLQETSYIDPDGYEYRAVGYRWQTWSGKDFTGSASASLSMGYDGIVDALRRAYNAAEPPWSLQATIVLQPTGAQYAAVNRIRIIWQDQNKETLREESYSIGRGERFTDAAPEDYTILSVRAYMLDVWKINNEITVDPSLPVLEYDKFCEEYSLIYTLELTEEERNGILRMDTEETASPSDDETKEESETAAPSLSRAEASSRTANAGASAVYPAESLQDGAVPTASNAEERASSGSRVPLILGCGIGIVVIYFAIIWIGTTHSKNKNKRKKRL